MATVSSYRIWTADRDVRVIGGADPNDPKKYPYQIPGNPDAGDICFCLDSTAPHPPSMEQKSCKWKSRRCGTQSME